MSNESVKIGFAGDVMIGRSVDPVISTMGYAYVWGNVMPLLQKTDINIVNLETTFTTSNKPVYKVFNFKAAPDKVKALTASQISIVSLANNHVLDFSEEGLLETIDSLQSAGIMYAGAGSNSNEAAKPVILEKNNLRAGLVAFTDNEPSWEAGPDTCGINYLDIADDRYRQKALESISRLAKQTDITIVSVHWGPNMREHPPQSFTRFAHDMIDHGACIVHGHSAHIFQAIEIYRHKLILYDTGDFVDDYVVDPQLKNDHSFLYLVEASKQKIESVQLVPVVISNYQVNLAAGKDYEWSMKRIQTLSERFGTAISDTGNLKIEQEVIHS